VTNPTHVFRPAVQSIGASRWLTAWVVVAVALLVVSLGGARDFSHIDEHRYAEVSRVMAAPGGDWLVPHLNGAVYHDKPPLFFWIAASAQRLGIALPAAAILPSQLGAAAALLAVFGIARRLAGLEAALASLVLLASGVRFASFAGRANLDALLTGFVAVSLYAYIRGDEANERTASRGWYAIACLAAGLGVLVKGPLAIAIPALAIAASRLLEGRARSFVSVWVPAAFALALLPVALWLPAAGAHAGSDYVARIVMRHAVEHSLGLVAHGGAPLDYLRIFPVAFLPGAVLLPAAFATLSWRRPLARADAFPLAWFCGGILLLSLFPVKRHHYLMPIYPGAALFAARLATRDVGRRLGERRIARVLLAAGRFAIAALGAALGVALLLAALLSWFGVDPSAVIQAPSRAAKGAATWQLVVAASSQTIALGVALGIASLAGMLLAVAPGSRSRRAAGLAVIALAATLVQARVIEPILEPAREKRAFLESVAARIADGAVADYGGMHFAANWVLRRDVVPLLGDGNSAERFLAESATRPAFLLADRANLDRKGIPAGVHPIVEWPRALAPDLVLLGSQER